jgi:hypothetical protein
MSDTVQISLDKLPEISHNAMWDDKAGLIVSPLTLMLPDDIADPAKPSEHIDLNRPRLLTDAKIYLAFYSKNLIYHKDCHIFSCLSISELYLADLILPVKDGLGYALHPKWVKQWMGLEETLISIINTLMSEHRYSQDFPTITLPRWLYHMAYQSVHLDQKSAFQCAKQAKEAFGPVLALVTFFLSLWLGENRYLCFDLAWSTFADRLVNPIARSYLVHLENSFVCRLDPGLRVGGFLDPYNTRWALAMKYFVQAGVPFR